MPDESRGRRPPNNINGKIFGKEMDELKRIKRERLKAILEFARTEEFVNQTALAAWLGERGLGCDQGQVSKDFDTLGLVPYYDKYGKKRLGRRSKIASEQIEERFVKIFQEAVLAADRIDNLVFIETVPGQGVGVATIIEAAGWQREVLTVSYGQSTVTILCWNDDAADDVLDRIREGIL